MKKLYKASELAKILSVHPSTIYKLAERGEIESYRLGGSVRFVMPELVSERTKRNDTSRANY